MPVNLGSGEYEAVVLYDGLLGKNQSTAKIIIRPTVFAEDIVKYYKNNTQFYASFLDKKGNVLKNSKIQFNVNGIFYTRTTDNNGTAKLNINLGPDNYIITSINSATGEKLANSIEVKPVIVDNFDLVKYYINASQFSVRLLDGQDNFLGNAKVSFNINGRIYDRPTDENGTARLSINLAPGNYIITSGYNGAYVSNDIFILTWIITNDLSMKQNSGGKFKVIVLDEKGDIAPGEIVTFNINGKFYTRTVASNGIDALNINLGRGKYIITSSWDEYSVANKITVTA